ncbi:MAG: nucleotidyltransferase domain-containing protein [Candidatus Vogelbacteria bacterium]|nr:nucleotidyltransferase domain-containing protein [Candidatus Vogelbacteria bacterium]
MSENRQVLKLRIREAIERSPDRALIRRASLFGSYAYGTPKEDSDVDLLVEFVPEAAVGFFELSDIKFSIEDYINKKVDLLTPDALSKYFRDEVIANAQLVYEN